MYYFAYGSNMAVRRLTEREVKPLAVVGVGYIDNWRIRFNKRSHRDPRIGFANIEPFWGGRVYGVIFGLRQEDIEKLDRFEGYPKHYQRTELAVNWSVNPETTYKCVTYIANSTFITDEPLGVTQEYRDYINIGVREHIALTPFTGSYVNELHSLMNTNDDGMV